MRASLWPGLTVLALASLLFAGCGQPSAEELANGDDPFTALRSPLRSVRYDGAFWNREAVQSTELWADAVAYCRTPGNSAAPNCQTVGLVLSQMELEKAAKEAKRQLQILLEQSKHLRPLPPARPGRAPGASPGGQD
ncbi:MAG: hypothetical protein KJ058_05905 [Thermoanaerobaculia bacterium]|nr:hypothetical protein [Thermoanaerobaculia bacterium]